MKNSYKNLTYPELKAKREELIKSYMELRFNLVVGHIENPLEKRTKRRQIARLHTRINQFEREEAAKRLKENVPTS